MAVDFSKFDAQVDSEQLKKDVAEAEKNGGSGDFEEVPKGVYMVDLERLEVRETKGDRPGRPMVSAMFRIIGDEDGNKIKFTKSCLFVNRVIYGTKNDANAIASTVGWLKSLEPSEDVGDVVFESYSQFADLVLDIEEDVRDAVRYIVDYDPDQFNSVSIQDFEEK